MNRTILEGSAKLSRYSAAKALACTFISAVHGKKANICLVVLVTFNM